MILGVNTAIRALKSVEAMDKLGPAYLMARENAAEKENTLRMGLMLVFMDVVLGDRLNKMPFHLIIQYAWIKFFLVIASVPAKQSQYLFFTGFYRLNWLNPSVLFSNTKHPKIF